MQNINPTHTDAWKALQEHYAETKDRHMLSYFEEDSNRVEALSIEWGNFYVDFSKNRITLKTRELLLQLAEECKLKEAIADYFSGEIINKTENRAVLHTALRADVSKKILVDGENIIPEIEEVKAKIKNFSAKIISGSKKGHSGMAFTDVVNIGIGGSDLGPVMVTKALKFYGNHLKMHFVSNIDGDHIHETLQNLNPETTLFIIVSKSFTTQETLTNAETIKKWFLKSAPQEEISKHFVAISSNVEKAEQFGIISENIFPMWEWVGGRFSLWSAVGLSISLAIGFDNFSELLEGAQQMDEHFKDTDFKENIPVQLALLSIWYNNFYETQTEAVIPYSQYLELFPAYLQQAIMESNGKSVDRNGNRVAYQTGTIIWGEPGTNSQHAFFQLIHQGTKLIPAEFIGFKKSLFKDQEHQDKLMANFFAQTEALLKGKNADAVWEELKKNSPEAALKKLVPFKTFEGNKPTTTILVDQLTPSSLGKLIALYEHKIFVQGVIWNIFSYDQWGVELGKHLAADILKQFELKSTKNHDSSTKNLLNRYFKQ